MQQENGDNSREPGLHVDEDWKETVAGERRKQREKEQAGSKTAEQAQRPPLPEPSVQIFMAGLYTQTLVLLGLMPNPATGETSRDLAEAQYLIDTIAMLQEKTKGNLTEEESSYLEGILYDLRMRFVSATSQPEAAAETEGTSES